MCWSVWCYDLNTLANVMDTYRHAQEFWLGPNMSVELDLFTQTLCVECRNCRQNTGNTHFRQESQLTLKWECFHHRTAQNEPILTGWVVRDLLCHKAHTVGWTQRNWTFWHSLLNEKQVKGDWQMTQMRLYHCLYIKCANLVFVKD